MKAAEEGRIEIMKMLLDHKADMEASNRKGRTALSFAAAPSMKRATPVGTLRMLLGRGADRTRTDDSGMTPRAHAEKELREDAIGIFQEYDL